MKALLAALCGLSGVVFSIVGAGMLLLGGCMSSFGGDVKRADQIGTGTVAGTAMEVTGTATDGLGAGLFFFGIALVAVALVAAFRSGRAQGPRGPPRDAWE